MSYFDLDDDYGSLTVPFGKYRGWSVIRIAEEDPRYLGWLTTGTDWGQDHAGEIEEALLDAAKARVASVPAPALTPHQLEKVEQIMCGIDAGHQIVRLEGGAGYGKSYVTQALARQLIERGYKVRACAVSYVATQVLASQLDPLGVETGTVARTLKFTKEFVDGVEVYEHSPDTLDAAHAALSRKNALIVDECSMICDRDARLLLSMADHSNGGLLILVGDSAQLPPVKQETKSLCCTDPRVQTVATLTVPMRYSADSQLFQVEQAMRNDPFGALSPRGVFGAVSEEVVRAGDANEFFNRFVETYRAEPSAVHRMLLFRRADVTAANNAIRTALFGEDADVIEVDEQLMVLATTDTPFNPGNVPGASVRYYSGQIFRVVERYESVYSINIAGVTYEIPHLSVLFQGATTRVRILFAVSETQTDRSKPGGAEFTAALNAAAEYAQGEDQYGNRTGDWTLYRQLRADFLPVAYTYATSVHRAQGQTVDFAYCQPHTLVNVRGQMGRALAYVACTRAKKRLVIL